MQNNKRTVCFFLTLKEDIQVRGNEYAGEIRFITTTDSILQALKNCLAFYKKHKDIVTENVQGIYVFTPIESEKQKKLDALYANSNSFESACNNSYDLIEDLYEKDRSYLYGYDFPDDQDISRILTYTDTQETEVTFSFDKWDLAITDTYI